MTPPGARCETRLIHEPWTVCDAKGERDIVKIQEYQYFIYDDLDMDFTGELELSYPIGDLWDYPWSFLNEEDLEPIESVTLYFENGLLIAADEFSA